MFDTGSTSFMLVCSMLVFLMTPGLAIFYGGLSQRKNVINTMFMSIAVIGIAGVAWVLLGWSLAYGGDGTNPFVGGIDQIACLGLVQDIVSEGADVSEATVYPVIIDVVFQAAFVMITAAIITGALAGRMKFGALVAFVAVWTLLVYAPLAHMVWGGESSLIGGMIGALDFAGGDVVHISSGVTGLVLCLLLGKRKGFGIITYRPHNIPFIVLGTALLWFGWFGFNAGSALAANSIAALALLNTVVASGAGLLSWMIVDRVKVGKPTLVGACTGLVAGLVVITPGAGYVEPWAAIVMGFIVSPVCYFAISMLKVKFAYDDALDAFGCHAVGGIVGGVLTGVFCVPELSLTGLGGLIYTGDPSLLLSQILGILVTLVFVVAASAALAAGIKVLFKGSLRVCEQDEAQGLDAALHGESAYPAYLGLD